MYISTSTGAGLLFSEYVGTMCLQGMYKLLGLQYTQYCMYIILKLKEGELLIFLDT
jgi:hypothetical protein